MHDLRCRGQSITVVVTACAILLSLYLQYTEALQPCPLCLMQRGVMLIIFLSALVGLFTARRFFLSLTCFFSLIGAFFASRQLWLQSLPVPDTGMCLPGVETLVHKLPWHEMLHAFLWGGQTSCGEVTWRFAGFSMPAWSLIYFSLIGMLSLLFRLKYFRDECV